MWPFKRQYTERRIECRAGYTDQLVKAILSTASGGGAASPYATAALESGGGPDWAFVFSSGSAYRFDRN